MSTVDIQNQNAMLTLEEWDDIGGFQKHPKYASEICCTFYSSVASVLFENQDDCEYDAIYFITNAKHTKIGNLDLSSKKMNISSYNLNQDKDETLTT